MNNECLYYADFVSTEFICFGCEIYDLKSVIPFCFSFCFNFYLSDVLPIFCSREKYFTFMLLLTRIIRRKTDKSQKWCFVGSTLPFLSNLCCWFPLIAHITTKNKPKMILRKKFKNWEFPGPTKLCISKLAWPNLYKETIIIQLS